MCRDKKCTCRASQSKHVKLNKNIAKVLKDNALTGIRLDVGCGGNKQKGYVGMDIRAVDGVDIVHDLESVPYPLPKEICESILASHILEHICPKNTIKVLNEFWRIMKPGGQLFVSLPYGRSFGFMQDPTHANCFNEATFLYFSPDHPLYRIYFPKPWKVERNAWWENGNMEVILSKMTEEEAHKVLASKQGVIN